MLEQRTKKYIRVMLYYAGYVVAATGLLQIVPLITGIISAEWPAVLDFFIGMAATVLVGCAMIWVGIPGEIRWAHGLGAVSISWLVLTVCSAVPYWLSGHYLSYLDAVFDVMSGFTTTGLVLMQDLDHVSNAVNMWRHLLSFVGGQGMVVLALTFLTRSMPGCVSLYVGEAKDEKLLPNVLQTSRAIWRISMIYLGVGSLTFWVLGMLAGLSPVTAFWEGIWVYMAAWSTGGFAPHTQNILYYHSFPYEMATLVFCVVGSLNFGLHYAVWRGKVREIYQNIEARAFASTVLLLSALATAAFGKSLYPGTLSLLRRGVYQVISAHTTTGFMTVYPSEVAYLWPSAVTAVLCVAMILGGSATSTAGGIKALRVGVIVRVLVLEVKRLLAPQGAVFVERFHFDGERNLEEKAARLALLVTVLYIATFGALTIAGSLCGFPLDQAAFEAASVTGNVGLSSGLTSATMPSLLKVMYIVGMWAGRMEFMTLLVSLGLLVSVVNHK